ncbi:hypothetical protein LCGC14_0145860 [marine sediment metagenome]|uniref:Uncharacterized protein n=1 Tax=marine sediment metagenome TaxID=412755 RepID=A0A0F9UZU5_9ZZZZ
MKVTHHGKKRMRQRIGTYSENLLRKVLEQGKSVKDLKGRLKRYIEDRMRDSSGEPKKVLLYGHQIYVFTEQADVFITTYSLPSPLRRYADAQR